MSFIKILTIIRLQELFPEVGPASKNFDEQTTSSLEKKK